jgi:hypothetical protein
MDTKNTVEVALHGLQQLTGWTSTWQDRQDQIDGEVDISFDKRTVHFYVEVKRELRQHHVAQLLELRKQYRPLLVIAENIFPEVKRQLRANNIAHLDGAGNLFINKDDIYIWMEGHKSISNSKPVSNRAFTKTGLKLVFYLLQHPDALNLPYRQLADHSGTALGNVKNVIDGLRQSSFLIDVNKNTLKLRNKRSLLDRWIIGYRDTLQPTLQLGTFRFLHLEHVRQWQALPLKPDLNAWGGEPAAEYYTHYLTPQLLTLYTDQPKTAHMVNWRLLPDPGGNLSLYQKFWKQPSYNAETGVPLAPPLLVYTDLLLTDDPRCIETAQRLYDQYLKHEFE